MAKSERQRQKKADAKKRRDRKRKAKEDQRSHTNQTLADFRRQAPAIKQFLKQRGYEWKFYDYLDSYRDAFEREIGRALQKCPSLLGVHEVDDDDYFATNHDAILTKLGLAELRQVFFNGTDVANDYLAKDKKSNVNGVTVAYRDGEEELKTLVLIRKTVPNELNVEAKYALKLIALFHELGHVKDWEQGIHLKEGDVAVLDAEVYAHEFGLRKLMEGDYRAALNVLLPALEESQKTKDYRKKVADRIVGSDLFVKCQECAKENWSDYMDGEDVSAAELMRGNFRELPGTELPGTRTDIGTLGKFR